MWQRNLTILKMRSVPTSRDEMTGTILIATLTDDAAVAMEQWSMQHHAYIVETYFKNGDSS
jgi:hypothetical protein